MPRCMSMMRGQDETSTTDKPVVVRPLVDSKTACATSSVPDRMSGSAYTAMASSQMSTVTPAASARESANRAASRTPKKYAR